MEAKSRVAGRYYGRYLPGLREARLREEISQDELAAKSGVTQHTISRLEWGHQQARDLTSQKLAKALGVDTEELYGGG